MHQLAPFLADPKLWIPALSLLVACWAAFNSWKSRRIATRALAISERQEQQRQPQLGIYLTNGYRRYLADKQIFGFLVSVSNPSDINNSIAQAELQVAYTLERDIKAVVRLPHTPQLAEPVSGSQPSGANIFSLPMRVDAHQTVAGWLLFALDNAQICGRNIDTHRIILEDSHGFQAETEPILVADLTNETPQSRNQSSQCI